MCKKKTIDRAIGKHKNEENKQVDFENDDIFDPDFSQEDSEAKEVAKGTGVIYPVTLSCCDCGEGFTVSPGKQKFFTEKGWELPKRCPVCASKKRDVTSIICVDCGATFTIDYNEEKYFRDNGLELPKRCKQCRDFKRERNSGANVY